MRRKFEKIDINSLEFIPENEVPAPRATISSWMEIFKQIPKGEALIIKNTVRHPNTVRTALKKLQKNGLFSNLVVRVREDKAFIIHSSEVSQT